MKESELAGAVKAWLVAERWEVYSEVRIHPGHGQRADLVAQLGQILWVIETKASLSLAVMAQAQRWLWAAHRVSVAVLAPRRGQRPDNRLFAEDVLRRFGIGLLEVRPKGSAEDFCLPEVDERLSAALRRGKCEQLRAVLGPQHQHAGAGTPSSFWSPYRQTCANLAAIVGKRPGIPMREAFASLRRHHYASDSTMRSSLAAWLREGKVRGVERRTEGRKVLLYPGSP